MLGLSSSAEDGVDKTNDEEKYNNQADNKKVVSSNCIVDQRSPTLTNVGLDRARIKQAWLPNSVPTCVGLREAFKPIRKNSISLNSVKKLEEVTTNEGRQPMVLKNKVQKFKKKLEVGRESIGKKDNNSTEQKERKKEDRSEEVKKQKEIKTTVKSEEQKKKERVNNRKKISKAVKKRVGMKKSAKNNINIC